MDILYDYTTTLKLFARHSGLVSQITEVRTQLDAQGQLFASWFHHNGLPTAQGNTAIAEACSHGLISAIHAIAIENECSADEILEKYIEHLKAIFDSVQDVGVMEDNLRDSIQPVTQSPN